LSYSVERGYIRRGRRTAGKLRPAFEVGASRQSLTRTAGGERCRPQRQLGFENCHVVFFVVECDKEFFRHEPGIDAHRIRADIDIDFCIDIDTFHCTFNSGNIILKDRFLYREFHFIHHSITVKPLNLSNLFQHDLIVSITLFCVDACITTMCFRMQQSVWHVQVARIQDANANASGRFFIKNIRHRSFPRSFMIERQEKVIFRPVI
jgi:hypothetical protein